MTTYNEEVVPGPFEPLDAVAALIGSGLFGQYVVYERDHSWYFAGDPLAEVTVHPSSVRSTFTEAVEWAGTPWQAISEVLSKTGVEGWNAFGWACFEVASDPTRDGGQPLAHLMIPATEIRITAASVTIRHVESGKAAEIRAALATGRRKAGRPRPIDVRTSDGTYEKAVALSVADIRAGRLDKVILSRVVEVPFAVDLCATYVEGRAGNTPARSFLLDLGAWRAAGFSPETVVEVQPCGLASTQPLAGTRALTGDAGLDEELRTELCTDAKEVFEHATSVKLAFDELAGVGGRSATRVSEFLTVKARGSVQHLASRVETSLPPGVTSWSALGAVFPAVTASGIPKAAAYQLINELEDERRGLYSGTVLMAGSDGSLDAALVLRSVYQQGDRSWLRAGAGIVGDSRPDREFEETCEKLASVAPYLIPVNDGAS
ncbi:salicylate synthase [Kribbella sp. NBC_01245]|uniref:salicylate synthase n=1 Tax=Kribbella sp. NBC_01245 TaxID=2903578 RepID=UPI002E2978E1|nr:salicylate synthase [Kribbella sp. NBC_01245]